MLLLMSPPLKNFFYVSDIIPKVIVGIVLSEFGPRTPKELLKLKFTCDIEEQQSLKDSNKLV